MIHTICDYCLRQFGYLSGLPAICVHCGLENVRPKAPETTMAEPAVERAVRPRALPRKRGR